MSSIDAPTLTPKAAATTASTGRKPPTITSTAAAIPVSHHNPRRQRRDSSVPATVTTAVIPASHATGGTVTATIPFRPVNKLVPGGWVRVSQGQVRDQDAADYANRPGDNQFADRGESAMDRHGDHDRRRQDHRRQLHRPGQPIPQRRRQGYDGLQKAPLAAAHPVVRQRRHQQAYAAERPRPGSAAARRLLDVRWARWPAVR